MSSNVFLLTDDGTDSLFFDICVSEQHEGTLTITEHPVEKGAPIADHAREELEKLTLEVFVTNHPIEDHGGQDTTIDLDVNFYKPPLTASPGAIFNALEGAIKNAFSGGAQPIKQTVFGFSTPFDAIADTESKLRDFQKGKILLKVYTSFRRYDGMLLESFQVPRDVDSGSGASFTLNFRQIRIVESKIVTAPKSTEARGQKPAPKGTKDAKPPVKKESILHKWANSGGPASILGGP